MPPSFIVRLEYESGEEKVQHLAQPGLDRCQDSLYLMMMATEGTGYVESPSRRAGLDVFRCPR